MRLIRTLDNKYWWLILLLVSTMPILRSPGGIFFPIDSPYSDLLISHIPNALWIRHSIENYHQIPLWSPLIFSGYPLIANPLSGLWYPPGWITLLFPIPFGFNLAAILHIILGAWGVYVFLRQRGVGENGGIIGAILFAGLPKLYAHYAAGHITLVFAVCLTPWLLVSINSILNETKFIWKKAILPGLMLALIGLADIRWLAYATILFVAYSFVEFFRGRQAWGKWMVLVGLSLVIMGMIMLPFFQVFLDYVNLSTRGLMEAEDVLTLSLPVTALLNMVLPNIGGYAEWVFYAGVLFPIAVVIRSGQKGKWRGEGFWLWVGAISILYSLGSAIPGIELLTKIPGMNLLRVPPRALFITGIACCLFLGYFVDWLVSQGSGVAIFRKSTNLILAGMGLFFFSMAIGISVLTQTVNLELIFGALLFPLAVVILKVWLNKPQQQIYYWSLVFILMVNVGLVNWFSMVMKTHEEVFQEGVNTIVYLLEQGGSEKFRVYSPSYSIPQHTAARYSIELADGIDPMQLREYVAFMESATGVPNQGYSVTLPPFSSGNPESDNVSYVPDAALLGAMNIKYVVSAFPIKESENLVFVRVIDARWIYRVVGASERIWIEKSIGKVQGLREESIVEWTPNRIEIRVEGGGTLVMAENYYPGWRATVDGRSEDIQVDEFGRRRIQLVDGIHTVILDFNPFKPLFILVGLIIGVLLVTGFYFWGRQYGNG